MTRNARKKRLLRAFEIIERRNALAAFLGKHRTFLERMAAMPEFCRLFTAVHRRCPLAEVLRFLFPK